MVQDVEDEVTRIRSYAHDDEKAHVMEIQLHLAVLWSIADGRAADTVGMARAALETKTLDFARWYT